jgi:geranylgeranyl diphosphate synthase type II
LDKITQYRQLFDEAIKTKKYGHSPKELYQPIQYIMSLGGKRMRPICLLIACDLFESDVKAALPAALAVEIFHNFTLIHDDIMDKAPLRRNKLTVHEKWNENIAILSGDVMLVKAYNELCQSNASYLSRLLNVFNETAAQVCEGQQFDMNFETQNNVSINQYIEMITLKTAVLLGCSLKMGAIIGGATETEAEKLYSFGKHVGIAFQLQDDILDVYAETEKFGKQRGGDIIANKKTYLLLKAIELANDHVDLKNELNTWLNSENYNPEEKVNAVTAIYNNLEVKEYAKNEMQYHYNIALNHLKEVKAKDSIKMLLMELTDSLMVRES